MVMNTGASRQLVAQLEAVGLENLVIRERPLATLKPSEIRIRVRAASLNHRDLLVARGQLGPQVHLPLVPLSDCSGEVVEIGSLVYHFNIGDRVAAAPLPDWVGGHFNHEVARTALGSSVDGVLQQFFTADQRGFVPIPESLSFEEAATLPCAGLTAWNALFEQGNLKPGQTVLVQGSGGVSVFALQLAIAAGAQVIAASGSEAKFERLRRLGAVHVVDYRDPRWGESVVEVTGGAGVDHVIEAGGARTFGQSIHAAAVGGHISVIGTLSGAAGHCDTRLILAKGLRLQGVVCGSVEMFERMNGMIDALGIQPVIDRAFPLRDVLAACRYLEAARHVGKLVISM